MGYIMGIGIEAEHIIGKLSEERAFFLSEFLEALDVLNNDTCLPRPILSFCLSVFAARR